MDNIKIHKFYKDSESDIIWHSKEMCIEHLRYIWKRNNSTWNKFHFELWVIPRIIQINMPDDFYKRHYNTILLNLLSIQNDFIYRDTLY